MVVARVEKVARHCLVVQLRPPLPVHETVLKERHHQESTLIAGEQLLRRRATGI